MADDQADEVAKRRKEVQLKQQEQMRKQRVAIFEAQLKSQATLTLMTELNYVRVICDIPKEHRSRVKSTAEKSLAETTKVLAEAMANPTMRQARMPSMTDPKKVLHEVNSEGT